MSTPILVCKDLCKSYKGKPGVINGLNLFVPGGKIVGLLGPNGCGKSTLIKMVCGLLSPDSGEIEVCGEGRSESTNSLISYLPERSYFNVWMKVDELISYFTEFYPDFDAEVARRMLSELGIDSKSRLKTLSKGTKEKVQLILVMSRRAKLYLLDEPIAGVDPAARDYILETIISKFDKDATIIISTHLISDVEKYLDRFILINQGKVMLNGDVNYVKEEMGMSLDTYFREVFKCSRNF